MKCPLCNRPLYNNRYCPSCQTQTSPNQQRNSSHRNERLFVKLPRVPCPDHSTHMRRGFMVKFFSNFRRRPKPSSARQGSSTSDDDDNYDLEMLPIRKSQSVATLLPSISNVESAVVVGVAFVGQPLPCPQPVKTKCHKPHCGAFVHQTSSRDFQIWNASQLKDAVAEAKATNNYADLAVYYTVAFNSFEDLNLAFQFPEDAQNKLSKNSSGLDLNLVNIVYDCLMELPTDLQKSTLKSVISCLLNDQRSADAVMIRSVGKDNVRAYMILLQNPQFRKPSTYVVFAHLLRQVATLCESDQNILAEWLGEVTTETFRYSISSIQQFISIRMFPPRPQDLPPIAKCTWWIPCAVRTLAIFNVTNNLKNFLPFTEFYNHALDHWDLMTEYHVWESPVTNNQFSFCQYPFILSINAKKVILDGHAEEQMIAVARDSLIANIANHRQPELDSLFLNINVRRQFLLQDSLNEIGNKQVNLRKKLRINFKDEPGLDMGGLTKEWFQLLVRQIFNQDFGMFVYHPKSEVFWFSTTCDPERLKEYHLVGVLMGLAVYNGVILDVRFPHCCFKKLLSPPVVPRVLDIHSMALGVTTANMADFEEIQPDTARGLRELLNYNGNVEEDFGLNFQVTTQEFQHVKTEDLKENGSRIRVTNANREEYVSVYIDWFLNKSIFSQFKAFYLGFHSVCASNVLVLLRAEEIELLSCGSPSFDMSELKRVTTYDGFKPDDRTIRYFWELVLKLPVRHQKRLLLFVTGTDRVPAGGMKEMTFKISKMVSSNPKIKTVDMLPMAHTCFNQIVLPDYQDRHVMRQKLAIALAHGEGFGVE